MPRPSQPHDTPATQTWQQADRNLTPAPPRAGTSANKYGNASLCLAVAAFVSAPFLLLIPIAGFVPAVLAGAGLVIAWTGLRRSEHGTGLAVSGLIVSVVLFGLLAGIATLWNVVVVAPAIGDYQKLHEVIDHIKELTFGP